MLLARSSDDPTTSLLTRCPVSLQKLKKNSSGERLAAEMRPLTIWNTVIVIRSN